jgi:hypothetical protein
MKNKKGALFTIQSGADIRRTGYRTAVLVFNRIFNILTPLTAIFVLISGPDIGQSRNKDGGRNLSGYQGFPDIGRPDIGN